MTPIDKIKGSLPEFEEETPAGDGLAPTAVAMLLNMGSDGLSVFFIERALDERDPWSGNIGFPGGRKDAGDRDLRHTAERETFEEVGISLSDADLIGRLPDISGAHLPVLVSCFVYGLKSPVQVSLNDEVNDAFWLPIKLLIDPYRHETSQFSFRGDTFNAPAIRLPFPEKQLLWGITYRLVCQLIDMVYPDNNVTRTKEGLV